MPIGLPSHLAPHNVARAYGSASHSVALYCLVGASVVVLGVQAANPGLTLWPALLGLLPMVAVLYLLDRRRTAFRATAYLLVGGACLYWYSVVGVFENVSVGRTDAFLFTLPKLALVFVGAGTGVTAIVAWSGAGLVTGELAVALASWQAGGRYEFDATTIGAVAAIWVVVSIVSLYRSRASTAQPSFTRAARDEHLSAVRYRIEVKAAAIMHDTVLNHLAAVAAAPPGPLSGELRSQITRDLEVLLGEEWLLDADSPDPRGGTGWRSSSLFAAIEEARQLGLEVDVSGDVSAVTRLDPAHALAVGLAAKQCLVNVIRHSGVTTAEVVVYGSGTEVSVMVIDAGKGFSEAETGSDRLGLRQSVRHRIKDVGGDVQVWSTPGRGTSVMIRVPARQAGVPTGGVPLP